MCSAKDVEKAVEEVGVPSRGTTTDSGTWQDRVKTAAQVSRNIMGAFSMNIVWIRLQSIESYWHTIIYRFTS